MGSMKSWMLGAALVAAGLGASATTAKAAEFGVYVGGPVAYVPPCPGPGYFWTAGYYAHGYWVPGRWDFRGVRDRDRYEFRRHEERRDFDRHYDRDHDRYRDHDRR